ncbi:hairy-related 8.2 [Stigmatopora nigra]
MTASSMAHTGGKHHSAKEERKIRKPLIERKRRERINNCLDQLKETVICAFRLDQSKLEKADILEMTVKHLQNIQMNKLNDPVEDKQKYSKGYIQCMHEVQSTLLTCDWMDKTLGSRLLNHLLRSLPRTSEEHTRHPPLKNDAPTSVCQGSIPPSTSVRRDMRHHPTCHVSGIAGPPERDAHHNSQFRILEMWRPW